MTHDYPPTIIYDDDKPTYYLALTVLIKQERLTGSLSFERRNGKDVDKKKRDSPAGCDTRSEEPKGEKSLWIPALKFRMN